MRRTILPMTVILAALLGLLLAAPASAATTGTVCGQVTAFAAPTADADGSITIDGTLEVIDQSAFGVIEAATIVTLTAIAEADATTCLEIVANDQEEIVDIAIAAQAEICGAVTLDSTTDVYSVAGVELPLDLVAADADLMALLDAAIATDATVCVDVVVDSTTGLVTSISLTATLALCGDVALDADSVTIGGVNVPLSLFDAEAQAVLGIAVDANAEVCVSLIVEDTQIIQANLTADIEICGEVTLDADGNAVVDGVVIDADLLHAGAAALLELAASADGDACVLVSAVSTDGDTSVGVTVTIEVCAEVTAIGDGTITLDGVTLVFAGAAEAGIEVGDVVCVAAATGPTGDPIVTDIDTTDDDPGTEPGNGPGDDGDDGGALPDTQTGGRVDLVAIGAILLITAGIAYSAVRRSPFAMRPGS